MDRRSLYKQFLQMFPLKKLVNMTIEEYTNLDKESSFCYWIETKTRNLGQVGGSNAYKFGIYKFKKSPKDNPKYAHDNEYSWNRQLGRTSQEAFSHVRDAIVKIADCAQKAEWEEIEKINVLWPLITWKIAFLYSNEQLLPIYHKNKWLIPIAAHFGMPDAKSQSRAELYRFLLIKKGDKDLFDFYEELLAIHKEMQPETSSKTAAQPTKTEKSEHYWWLVASPDVWKFSAINNGEIIEYTLLNEKGSKRRVYRNFLNAKTGDKVIGYASTPTLQIVAIGEIAKDTDGKHLYFRKTEHLLNPIDYSVIKGCEELQNMECMAGGGRGTLFKVTEDEYDVLMDIIRTLNPLPSSDSHKSYTNADFLQEVYMSSSDLMKLQALLRTKKNVILQGAPGVGKTFTAERLAFTLMGVKDSQRVEKIQFHQNYSYEDFITGYKPNANGGFDLKNGIFYKFCKKALNTPDKDFFFIIDEINRGNLSKIFGELLMLIENNYRGKELKLAYTDELFTVPDNLYIIGTMNTADRSLAMIDYALRRRFSFFEMHPGFETEGFKNYQTTLSSDKFNNFIQGILALNKVISDDDSLGNGFCIGHSYFCNQR